MMAFLKSRAAQKGYQRQDELIPLIEVILIREGYDCKVSKGTLNEDMKEHIDAKISCDKTPFKGRFVTPIDIKTGKTFTLYSSTGLNTLENSKSVYLVYEYKETDQSLMFVSVSKLREVVKKYRPRLFNGKYDNSKYFWIGDYVDDHIEEFTPNEIFWIKK